MAGYVSASQPSHLRSLAKSPRCVALCGAGSSVEGVGPENASEALCVDSGELSECSPASSAERFCACCMMIRRFSRLASRSASSARSSDSTRASRASTKTWLCGWSLDWSAAGCASNKTTTTPFSLTACNVPRFIRPRTASGVMPSLSAAWLTDKRSRPTATSLQKISPGMVEQVLSEYVTLSSNR